MIEKIAILADSGSDISVAKKDAPLFVLPLRIIIDGKEYVDKKDISLNEVLSQLDLTSFTQKIKEKLVHIRNFTLSTITPALAIHTGPEALGIAVSII